MNELHLALIEVQTILDRFVKPLADKGRDEAEINPINNLPIDYGKQDYDKVKILVQVFMGNLWDLGLTDRDEIINKLQSIEDSLQYEDPREEI